MRIALSYYNCVLLLCRKVMQIGFENTSVLDLHCGSASVHCRPASMKMGRRGRGSIRNQTQLYRGCCGCCCGGCIWIKVNLSETSRRTGRCMVLTSIGWAVLSGSCIVNDQNCNCRKTTPLYYDFNFAKTNPK